MNPQIRQAARGTAFGRWALPPTFFHNTRIQSDSSTIQIDTPCGGLFDLQLQQLFESLTKICQNGRGAFLASTDAVRERTTTPTRRFPSAQHKEDWHEHPFNVQQRLLLHCAT